MAFLFLDFNIAFQAKKYGGLRLLWGGTKIFLFFWGGTLIGRGEFGHAFDSWTGNAPIMENPDQDLPTIIYRSE